MEKSIKFDNLSIARKGKVLIEPFSSELTGGDLVILTGANGAGKSTLLQTLVGLIDIHKGGITIDNMPMQSFSIEERSRVLAYSNSKKIEEDYIRIFDLVALGRYPYLKVNPAHSLQDENIQYFLGALGIEAIQEKFLNEISDGELQKASIARALVQDAPIIVLDEPTAFLDYPSKLQLFELLKKLAIEKNKIILCATHDVEMAAKYGTRFWHLENKFLKFSDKAHEWTSL